MTWLSVAGPLAQLRPREPGCSGLPSNFRTSRRVLVDIGQQAAGRFAVEAGGGHQHEALFDRFGQAFESSSTQSSQRSFGGNEARWMRLAPG